MSGQRISLGRDRLGFATRDAILEAAAAAFADTCGGPVRMRQIAGHAKIAVGTLYNYFEDRSALMTALADKRKNELFVALDRALAVDAPFCGRLGALVQVLIEHFEANRRLHSTLLDATHPRTPSRGRASSLSASVEVLNRAEQLLSEGVRGGAIRAADLRVHAVLLVGMVRGAVLHVGSTSARPTSRVEQIIEIFLNGCAQK